MTAAGTLTAPTSRRRRWPAILILPPVAIVIAAAASPSIAHALPGFFCPAVTLIGGVAATAGLVRALLRFARGERLPRVHDGVRLATVLVAFVLLAVLPLIRLIGILTAPTTGPPHIPAGFGDWIGGEGYPHPGRHRGIDVRGAVGSDVLAAADGRVVLGTVYCHSATLLVRAGDEVRRGQRIATLGTTGQRGWPGYEHVHLELQRGSDRNDVENPLRRLAGCFDARAAYPTDRLVLTYPVSCRERGQ